MAERLRAITPNSVWTYDFVHDRLASGTTLKILCVLGEQEVNVQDIVDAVGTSQSNISQHLAILRDKEIVGWRKDGNRVFYRVADNRTLQLIAMMREVFCSGDTNQQ